MDHFHFGDGPLNGSFKQMNYCNIKNFDIANGYGVRVSLFVSGCTNACKGCFQPETWDFQYGEPFTEETENKIIDMLDKEYIDGITLLGGDPFEPKNQVALVSFLRRIKRELPSKNIWAFTGFTLEELKTEGEYSRTDVTDEMLNMVDVLIDGRFIEEKKDIRLQFCGSQNQRLIDMNLTRKNGEITLWEDPVKSNI